MAVLTHRHALQRRLPLAAVLATSPLAILVSGLLHADPAHFSVETDSDVAQAQDGPHDGGGPTTGHSFFEGEDGVEFVFKKRVLHEGSAIGLHVQHKNEIYYVLSGTGEYTMDDETITVTPGMALLTRPGGAHALKQTGSDDLVVIIVYPR